MIDILLHASLTHFFCLAQIVCWWKRRSNWRWQAIGNEFFTKPGKGQNVVWMDSKWRSERVGVISNQFARLRFTIRKMLHFIDFLILCVKHLINKWPATGTFQSIKNPSVIWSNKAKMHILWIVLKLLVSEME